MVNVEQTPVQELPVDEPLGALEPVAYFNGAMPTGVTVSQQGRIFVNFPKWGDDVQFTVAELRKGEAVAHPDVEINQTDPNNLVAAFVSVQSVVVDPVDRLWILDTGSPLFQPTKYGGPKFVCVNLNTGQVSMRILFPQEVALPTTYLNDVRFDLRRGSEGMAFITDSAQKGPNGIIIVDLASGQSWRRLHDHPQIRGTTSKNMKVNFLSEYLSSLDDKCLPIAVLFLSNRIFPGSKFQEPETRFKICSKYRT
jgi:hypothetical protein